MTARIESTPLVQADTAASETHVEAYLERFRAPFSLRCGALLIDYIILAGIIAFSTLLARMGAGGHSRTAGDSIEWMGVLIALGVMVLNFVILPAWISRTLGKWATGLRIARVDGQPMGVLRSLVRHLLGYPLSLLTLGLGFLFAAFHAHGRALHDLISGTVVVREHARRARTAVP